MNIKYIIIITLSLFCFTIMNSCQKGSCRGKVDEHYTFPDEMEKYFGVFQPDNYWIYYNQDSSKKDSIYISDFEENIRSSNIKPDCVSWDEKDFVLHSDHLVPNYKAHEVEYTFNCCNRWKINVGMSGSTPMPFQVGWQSISNNNFGYNSDSLDSLFIINSKEINNTVYVEVLSYTAQRPLPNFFEGTILFAPNIGIIQFSSDMDTFKISKHNL
ncbi:MAG: hypothetical protein WD048_16265 [Chitinophagales bacterium]